ncbi:MAG: PilW family protein [Proteobacteria bacterium]|nr:PilW family protein [Pseudomonadota bacterium]
MRVDKKNLDKASEGFTLVELLITMVLSVIIVVAIYSAFKVQQRSYVAQDAVTEMQQNIRAALLSMASDIRMASFDSTGTAGAGFIGAQADAVAFTADLDESGDLVGPGEHMGYYLYSYPAPSTMVSLRRVVSDSTNPLTLVDDGTGHYQVQGVAITSEEDLAENIEELEFDYLDSDGNSLIFPINLADIIFIRISILARSGQPDPQFSNTSTYTMGSGTEFTYSDNIRRRLLVTTVNCRNMGL